MAKKEKLQDNKEPALVAECFTIDKSFIDGKVVNVAANFLLEGGNTFKVTNPDLLGNFEAGKKYSFVVNEA